MRRRVRAVALRAVSALAFLTAIGAGADLRAQDTPVADWEISEPGGWTILKLFAPSSGALLAWGRPDLRRSDDAGATWRHVPLPPAPIGTDRGGTGPGEQFRHLVAVDPTDHTIVYAQGEEGLYRSDDDAASWRPIVRRAPNDAWRVEDGVAYACCISGIAVSPADHQLVYLTLGGDPAYRGDRPFRLVRSRDGGTSWEQVHGWQAPAGSPGEAPCSWRTIVDGLLVAHPTQSDRVIVNVTCNPRINRLEESTDQGATWSVLFDPPKPASIMHFAGGQGVMPERLYVGVTDYNQPVARVFRSDDDGRSWAEMASRPDGAEPWVDRACLRGLTSDPDRPDHVYVAISCGQYGVWASTDDGATWTAIGPTQTAVSDLALGIDGRYLFAGTGVGVYRLRLR